jgi:fructokinase
VLTFSDPAMVEYFRDGINEIIGSGVDLLFCNEKEAMIWSGEFSFDAACEKLKTVAKRFAITRGANGAFLYDGKNYHNVAAQKVTAVDTNGAGDIFPTAGRLASLASATVVSSFGPRLQPEEHQQILRQMKEMQVAI